MKALPYILCAILLAGVVFLLLERRGHINAAVVYREQRDSAIVLRDGYLEVAESTAAKNFLLTERIDSMQLALAQFILNTPPLSDQVENARRTLHNADIDSLRAVLLRSPD